MTPRIIHELIEQAAAEYVEDGIIATDTAMRLASLGYDTRALERDVSRIANKGANG